MMSSILSGKDRDFRKLIDLIPSHPMPNYAFHNNGDLKFTNMAREWGLDQPGFSNGSAYVDLDNDGNTGPRGQQYQYAGFCVPKYRGAGQSLAEGCFAWDGAESLRRWGEGDGLLWFAARVSGGATDPGF
ncbi:hypothetical protein ACQ86N_00810 [Puia sp. P3]|uniref:hypothetical protein n=1 Tax=Puia sp. P3 TaxID=3423952 RepID=UPI003D67CAF6